MEFVPDCAATGAARKAPQGQGWNLGPCVRSSRSRDASWNAAVLDLGLVLSPASSRALSSHPRLRQKGLSPSAGGAGGKGFQPAAVKMSFVWVQKASTG